ncbi:pilus assembly protein TadG-related protein [Pseudomonas poae]|uniref:Putative Flp pilus-assembly TadG-like N-terminal domain-containing protein n=1 Tax=Pseudomonas poae TaxID=200451 RepID=A0A2S9EZ66_9PSED|nr:pilus assembly protein TadG-related protein [Pseudomonas poae]PRA30650.1 hypothetical protein CQZ97_08980 [Pseudomonas poae]PRC22500.1 hypothetical protein CQZ99_02810 [Pseudomonas poae]
MSPRLRSRQRGAIGLMATATLALALVFMFLAVDSGRLYLEKRKLQSIADSAALEAASRGGVCTPSTTANDYAVQNATRNGFTVVAGDSTRGLAVACGSLATNASNIRVFTADVTKNEAVRVIATRGVPTGIASGIWNLFTGTAISTQTNLTATAVAAFAPPVAQLTIRSNLATVDSTKSPLLNATLGGLLGGSLSITAAGYNGLLGTNVNLLSYLDQLALQLHVQAGDYDALLKTAVSASQLIDATVKVLQKNGAAVSVVTDALSIQAIAPNTQLLTVGDLLKVATGTPAAALNTNVQLFGLLQGVAQLSNSKGAVSAAMQINLLGLGNVSIQTKVIEAPQLSAIGNPYKAKVGFNQTPKVDQIFVRTAQVRTLISIDLPVLNTVSALASAVTSITTPVTGIVSNLLNLNLGGVINSVLCVVVCDTTDIQLASRLDILIEAGGAQSYVSDYSCASTATKSLSVQATTALATLTVGDIDKTTAFSSSAPVAVQPIRLIDIGSQHCVLLVICGARVAGKGGGLLLKAQSTIGSQSGALYYMPVAEMNQPPTYQTLGSTNLVASLSGTLTGLQVTYAPPSGSVSSGALAGVAGLLTTITNTLVGAIQSLLSPILDPILNTLLKALGITLGGAEVGANLTCHMGRAYLVI